MNLHGEKLLKLLSSIRENHEVSMYYKRHLLREGYIVKVQKPITGPGRPGFTYNLTEKAEELLNAVH